MEIQSSWSSREAMTNDNDENNNKNSNNYGFPVTV